MKKFLYGLLVSMIIILIIVLVVYFWGDDIWIFISDNLGLREI